MRESSPFFATVACGVLVALLPSLVAPSPVLRRTWQHIARAFAALARRPHLAVATVFVASLAWNLAPLAVWTPTPIVQDEFSYLLQADTFLHGRLANPTHPLWPAFEAPQVIHQPTYASKYGPGQGLTLAAGALLGHPIFGAKLALAAACAAVCWMLLQWLPGRHAVAAALLVALHLGGFYYWSQSFWGGGVPLCGGALVFGAWRSAFARDRAGDALLLGLGLVLLASSRPYEGALLAVFVAVSLGVARTRRGASFLRLAPRRLLLTAALVAAGLAALAIFNQRVTGSPLTLAHQVYAHTSADQDLLWLRDEGAQSAWVHPQLRTGWDHYIGERRNLDYLSKLLSLQQSHLGLALLIPLAALPLARRSRFTTAALALVLLHLVAAWPLATYLPHYAAPVSALLFFLVAQGLRTLRTLRVRVRGRTVGRPLARVAAAAVVLQIAYAAAAEVPAQRRFARGEGWHEARAGIVRDLESRDGNHLVLVRLSPGHNLHHEWVYNGADLDGARVVWAREVDEDLTARLREHYANRTLWRVRLDAGDAMHFEPWKP
jgi:hypothetical protein